jgi:hypothetical protein
MRSSNTLSSPIDTSSFAYVVGNDIGSQTCDFCVLKADKSQIEGISPENSMSEGTKKGNKNVLPNHQVGRAERDGARRLLRR